MYIGKQLIRGQNNIIDDISSGFNGSTTAFSLTASGDAVSPATVNQMFVSLGGVLQKPGTDFTLSSSTITFTTAPTSGLSFWCLVQGDSVDLNAPSDGSVTPSKISANGDFAFPADIRLKDSDGSHYVGLQAPATVGSNVVWTLPAADGTANYVLKTDGSGNLGWAADSSTDSTKMPLAGGSFTGDVVFTGDAANVTWDKSTDDLIFNDNAKSAFGTGSDLQIYHDGSDSRIQNTTGNLLVRNEGGGDVYLRVNATESAVDCIHNGAVNLYYDNVKRLESTSGGIAVTGGINLTTNLSLLDDGIAKFGTGDDLQIYHDGSNSNIKNTTGWLNVSAGGSGFSVGNGDFSENLFKATNNGAVELYYDNTKRIESTATGATITGSLTVGGISASGYADFTGLLSEACTVTAGKLSDNTNLDAANGNVFLFTTQETTTCTPNIRWDGSTTLNSKVNVGDMIAITVITTAAAGGYSAQLTIDGAAVTENWIGGSAPSAGGSSGKDIYSYTIVKTADATFTIIGNLVKTSS